MITQVGFGNGMRERERERERGMGFRYGRKMKRDKGVVVCGFWGERHGFEVWKKDEER